jgi:heme/copper-type cytochrome/quinol oxidase subunit 1
MAFHTEEGIHNVIVPATPIAAIAFIAVLIPLMAIWPWLRWVALASLVLGFVVAGGLIVKHRFSRQTPPAARFNFPPPERE